MKPLRVTPRSVGASNLIAHICKELQIARFVNKMVQWDEKQWKTSPGTLVVGLIINIMVGRNPLYLVEKFFEKMDPVMLFEEAVSASNFNDDALGRALDRLNAIDLRALFQTVACRAVMVDGISTRTIHADTTSISVMGEYNPTSSDLAFLEENPDRELLDITYGHSKQRRPDLKQFLCGLLVTKDGFPVMATVNDGNTSDKKWNRDIFDELETCFLDPHQFTYIADSALITKENLAVMAKKKMRFVSLLPNTFSLTEKLTDAAWSLNRWEDIGCLSKQKNAARYWSQTIVDSIDGREYRFVVVRSSALDKRKENSLQRRLKAELESLKKLKKELEKQSFACKPDAEQALALFLKENQSVMHNVTGRVSQTDSVKRSPGRPGKDETPTVTTEYIIELTVEPPTEKQFEQLRQRQGTFVLITTQGDDVWSDARVLFEYKNQASVETKFRFLKKPLTVDGIFLKSSRRAEALAYVILLALLVAAFIERRVRARLADEKGVVEVPGKRLTDKPSIRAILAMLNEIQIVHIESDTELHRILSDNTDPEALKLLRLLQYDEKIYISPK